MSNVMTLEERVSSLEKFLRSVYGTTSFERLMKITALVKTAEEIRETNSAGFKGDPRFQEILKQIEDLKRLG